MKLKLSVDIEQIDSASKAAKQKAREQWDSIFKPINGLGKLEKLIIKIAGIYRTHRIQIENRAVVVMCADNGIVEEKISQSGAEMTNLVVQNMLNGKASINQMAELAGAEVVVIDIGMKETITHSKLLVKKTADGSKNFLREPAMTAIQTQEAIEQGILAVKRLKDRGIQLIATGEMGIGNTTTSSAIACILLKLNPKEVVGRGAGLSDEEWKHKIEVIQRAIEKYAPILTKSESKDLDAFDVLSCVGGFDIAGITGVFLGGAYYHIPIVIDGLIAATGALLATMLCKNCMEYMLPSHLGKEPICKEIMRYLGLEPIIHADLALGEGTGAVLLFPMLDMALKIYNSEMTFQACAVTPYKRNEP